MRVVDSAFRLLNSASSDAQQATAAAVERLHQRSIADVGEIGRVIRQAIDSKSFVRRGLTREIDPELARIVEFDAESVSIVPSNFAVNAEVPVFLTGLGSSESFCFVVVPREAAGPGERFTAPAPRVLYRLERRDRLRVEVDSAPQSSRRVSGVLSRSGEISAVVEDESPDGLGIVASDQYAVEVGDSGQLRFLDGSKTGQTAYVEVCNRRALRERPGWTRIGLRASAVPFASPLIPEYRDHVLAGGVARRLRRRWELLSASVGAALPLPHRAPAASSAIQVVDFANTKGERLRAILDQWGDGQPHVAVIVPPAWGKTKETMVGLARTIVATFEHARCPVVVLRFDGIRKRGESHNDPGCALPGAEQHHFTFSQGVDDIRSAVDFLHAKFGSGLRIALVTFSAASIEGRRAVALEGSRINGWISVVGAADLQSAMRTVSGGVDFVGGAERGVRFGIQEVQGVEVNMDLAAADAIRAELAFMEDSRRDMARIAVPITWIHGRDDAWMSLSRSASLLGAGRTSNRRLLVIPTGHQLRTSREAFEVFELVASEIARLVVGRTMSPRLPSLIDVRDRSSAERERLPRERVRLRDFWRDYIVGREGGVGIGLLAATSHYKALMRKQIAGLAIVSGGSVVDIGSGTAAFASSASQLDGVSELRITCIDFVADAMRAARDRIDRELVGRTNVAYFVLADLEQGESGIPLRSGSQDAALASLVLSYVRNPRSLLDEMRRVTRSGGRVAVSSLRPDADTSKIYAEAAEELRALGARDLRIGDDPGVIDVALRSFLNDAARLLDLEERGVFHFWDADELSSLLRDAGFLNITVESAFGDPPQAVVAFATRP